MARVEAGFEKCGFTSFIEEHLFFSQKRGTLLSFVLETEFEKYSALSFKNILRSCCKVSDEGHDYALEVVRGKDAAQSFPVLFTGAGMKMDYSKPSLCVAVPFVTFLQSHSLLDVFINCTPFPWVLVINCNGKWKYSKINLFSWPSPKPTVRTLCRFSSLEGGGAAQGAHQSSSSVVPTSFKPSLDSGHEVGDTQKMPSEVLL